MTGILGGLIASIQKLIAAWATVSTVTYYYRASNFLSGNTLVVHDSVSLTLRTLNLTDNSTTLIVSNTLAEPDQGSLVVGADSSTIMWTRAGNAYKYYSGAVSAVTLTNGGAGIATNRAGTWLVTNGNDIAYSTNNTVSWTQTANILGTISADSPAYMSVSGTPTWAAFDKSSNTSFYTSTNLSTWTLRTLPFALVGNTPRNAVIVENGYAYAIAATTLNVWRSTDFINWTDLGNPSGVTTNDSRIVVASGNKLIYIYEVTPGSTGTLYTWQSLDNGNTWSVLNFATGSNSTATAGFSSYSLNGANGKFYLSIDATANRYTTVQL